MTSGGGGPMSEDPKPPLGKFSCKSNTWASQQRATTGNNGEQRATTTEQRRFVEGGFLKGDLLRRRLKTSILTWLSEIFVILE